jgi:hypothetical protein
MMSATLLLAQVASICDVISSIHHMAAAEKLYFEPEGPIRIHNSIGCSWLKPTKPVPAEDFVMATIVLDEATGELFVIFEDLYGGSELPIRKANHAVVDQVLAEFMIETGKRGSTTSVMDLMGWHIQKIRELEKEAGD